METTPIQHLKHHLEVLETQHQITIQGPNLEYCDILYTQINKFKEAIDILETFENRGETTVKRLYEK